MTNGDMTSPKKQNAVKEPKKGGGKSVVKKDDQVNEIQSNSRGADKRADEALVRIEQVFESKIEVLTNLINSKDKEISALHQLVGSLTAEITNLKKGFNFMSNETSDLKKTVQEVEKQNKEKISELQEKTIDLEDRGRRNNLVFYGIKELLDKRNTENCEELITQVINQHGIADFSGDYICY